LPRFGCKTRRLLFDSGRFDAAYYLAGYVVECALKACLCKKTQEFDFPVRDAAKFYQHDLKLLAGFSGIEDEFAMARVLDETLAENWNVVQDWKENRRYVIGGADWATAAKNLIDAIAD
jgi:hypothetical protein